jgi:hypothetical protein
VGVFVGVRGFFGGGATDHLKGGSLAATLNGALQQVSGQLEGAANEALQV